MILSHIHHMRKRTSLYTCRNSLPLSLFLLPLMFATLLWLSGCIFDTSSQKPPNVVRIGFFPTITHAPALVGTMRGDFEKLFSRHGVQWEPLIFSSGPAIIEAIFANRVDIAYVGPGPAISGFVRSSGNEIRVIAGCSLNGVSIVGAEDKEGIATETLSTKRVAVPSIGNSQFLSATHFLKSLEKRSTASRDTALQIIPCSSSDVELLLRKHQVDAAWLPEPWATKLVHEGKAQHIAAESDFWPSQCFPSAVVIASRRFVESRPDLVTAFVECHAALCDEINSYREKLAPLITQSITSFSHKSISEEVVKGSLQRTRYTSNPHPEEFGLFYEFAKESGFLRMPKTRITLETIFVTVPHGRLVEAKDSCSTTSLADTSLAGLERSNSNVSR